MSRSIPVKVEDSSGEMYAAEAKIYPREVKGGFQHWRVFAVFWLLGMYYLFPWLSWDGRQAVLFDLPARKFFVFGLTFWPQDFFYLAWLLIMAALALFFFTALAGRLWCGYACPQTVWTEVFLWMEKWTEGDRHRRMKLDAGPWTREKLLRKSAKHVLWFVFALWTGFTFVGFFTPIQELGVKVMTLSLGGWETFWILFYSLATWGNAGVLREQVCKYMCPYARFQSAMFDRDTLIISYDERRGEDRGARRRGGESVLALEGGLSAHALKVEQAHQAEDSAKVLGDCIDCTLCVQVCPTGIDIRDGLQYECIACAACIDVCDQVMDKMNYPRGLIRYTTQHALEGHTTHVLRGRTLLYGGLLLVLMGLFAWSVLNRTPLIVDVLRDRNALYRETADGRIENAYTLKLINKDSQARRYRIGVVGADVITPGAGQILEHEVAAGAVIEVPLTLSTPRGSVKGMQNITLEIEAVGGEALRIEEPTRFFAPGTP